MSKHKRKWVTDAGSSLTGLVNELQYVQIRLVGALDDDAIIGGKEGLLNRAKYCLEKMARLYALIYNNCNNDV